MNHRTFAAGTDHITIDPARPMIIIKLNIKKSVAVIGPGHIPLGMGNTHVKVVTGTQVANVDRVIF